MKALLLSDAVEAGIDNGLIAAREEGPIVAAGRSFASSAAGLGIRNRIKSGFKNVVDPNLECGSGFKG
jgi:hypothetical protein